MIPPSPNIEQMLLKRQVSIGKGRNNVSIGWEREKGKGYYFDFGEYKLSIRNSNGHKEDVIIEEDSKSISTRVWDCSVLTTKWFEQNVFSSSLPSSSLLLSSSSSSSLSSSSSSGKNLMTALRTKVDTLSKSKHNRPIQVLELGSGTGLLSICLAKMGGTNIAIMATEYGLAVNHLKKNMVRNYVGISTANFSHTNTTLIAGCVSCRELDWYKTKETLQSVFPNENDTPIFDLIVVTDCSLSERDSRGVLDMILKYGSPGHTVVVAGICNEREGTHYFIETTKNVFANYMFIPQTDYHKDYQSSRHKIMLIQV
jgi:predicted nicotinamide N-methyase